MALDSWTAAMNYPKYVADTPLVVPIECRKCLGHG